MRMKDKLYKYWTPHVRRGSFLWRIRRRYWIRVSKRYYQSLAKRGITDETKTDGDWNYSNNYVTTKKGDKR